MLPDKSLVKVRRSGIVVVRPGRGWENDGDARPVAVAIGSEDARGGGRAVRTGTQRRRAHQLSGGVAGRRGPQHHRDRLAGAPRARTSADDPAPLPERGRSGTAAAPADRATAGGDVGLAGRVAAGHRGRPAYGGGGQRGGGHAAAGRLSGAGGRAGDGERGPPGGPASPGGRGATAPPEA